MADLKIGIRHMLRMLSAGRNSGLPDDELLERFLEQRDEAAFESLLCRHGPMVLNTCRRLLGHLPDAEDAFQATFLVFCRKAKAIARRQSLGSWLHRVALRICLRAKATSQRAAGGQERRSEPAGPLSGTGTADRAPTALEQQEEWSVLDEELSCLPEKYRAPLVLHYLEGKTVEQAAVELGWRPGTVCGRLARGKDLLRSRLIRRGVTLTGGMVAGVVAPDLGRAALPPALVKVTVRAGLVFAGGQAVVPGAASARVLALAQRFLRARLFGRLKLLAAVFLTFGIAAAGAGVILSHTRPTDRIAEVPPPENAGPPNDPPARVDRDGDPLPAGARLRLGSARLGHGDWLKAMAYSRDGRTLVAAGDRGLVHTWDAATGRPLATVAYSPFAYQTQPVLSPDGSSLAVVVSSDIFGMKPPWTVLLMRLSRNAAPLRLQVFSNGDVRSLAFSPDGKYLAAGGEFDFILLWEVASGQLVRRFNVLKRHTQAVVLSPDGKLLAVDSQPALRLWDTATGQELRPSELQWKRGTPFAFSFSADGRVLAGGDAVGKISLWDLHTGKALRQFALESRFQGGRMEELGNLAFSPDSKLLAVLGQEGTARLWDITSGELRLFLPRPDSTSEERLALPNEERVTVAFSPDLRTLALGGGRGEIRLWDIASGRRIEVTQEPAMWPCFAAVSPDGQTLATARGYVQLWDTATGRTISTPASPFPGRFVNFSPDGTTLTNGASLWNLQTGKVVHSKTQGAVAIFSPDGQYLLASGLYYRMLRADTLHELWTDYIYGGGNYISTTAFSEKCIPAFSIDGKMVAWGCQSLPLDRSPGPMVILKETASGKEVRRIPCPDSCWAVAFCPDGRTLAVAGVNYIQLRDLGSGELVREIEKPSREPWRLGPWRRAMAISPDGTILAAAGENNSICLWEIATGRELGRLRGHHGQVLSLAFTPDGRSLISGSEDTTALVWDVARFISPFAQGLD